MIAPRKLQSAATASSQALFATSSVVVSTVRTAADAAGIDKAAVNASTAIVNASTKSQVR
jgi:hypothetical protein